MFEKEIKMVDLLGRPQQKDFVSQESQDNLKRLGELSERTRLLEERLKQTRDKMQVLDETFSNKIKDLKELTSSFEEHITTLRREFEETKEILRRIAKDMESTARVNDVQVLEKYINMIDFTRLVTKDDVIKMIDERIKRKD